MKKSSFSTRCARIRTCPRLFLIGVGIPAKAHVTSWIVKARKKGKVGTKMISNNMYGIKVDESGRLINIDLTDSKESQIQIGRSLFNLYRNKYTTQTIEIIKNNIKKNCVLGGINESIEDLFYAFIYDYWAYGANVFDEFKFDYINNSDIYYKSSFLTYKWHPIYINYLNTGDKDIIDDKYRLYTYLKKYYQRNVILLTESENDYLRFCNFVKSGCSYIVKPQTGYQTLGVYKICITEELNLRTVFNRMFSINSDLNSKHKEQLGTSIVLEEWIEQDERLSKLHPSSVNGIRITTIRTGKDIYIFHPWLKIGVGNADVTGSEYYGSMDALIDPNSGVVLTDGCTKSGERYQSHPTTGIMIKGYQVPRWNECVSLSKELASKFHTMRYIGWDLALTPNGWVVIEGNRDGLINSQWILNKGVRYELEELIKWSPKGKFWWE